MAAKTYNGAEIGQMKPQPEVTRPDQESAYGAGERAYSALGKSSQKSSDNTRPPGAVDPEYC